jgi:hypothetical protein
MGGTDTHLLHRESHCSMAVYREAKVTELVVSDGVRTLSPFFHLALGALGNVSLLLL